MDHTPQFADSITCPICGGVIPTVKMEVRFLARYTCPNCGNDVLIEGGLPMRCASNIKALVVAGWIAASIWSSTTDVEARRQAAE